MICICDVHFRFCINQSYFQMSLDTMSSQLVAYNFDYLCKKNT